MSTANPSGFGHILKNDGSLLHHGNAAALYLPVNQPTPTQYLNHDIVQAANPYNQTVYLKADGSLRRLVGAGRTDEQIVPGGVAIVAAPNGVRDIVYLSKRTDRFGDLETTPTASLATAPRRTGMTPSKS